MRILLVTFIVTFALSMVGIPALSQTTGGTLTVALMAEPDGLNLILTPAAASLQIVMYNINEPLLRYNADLSITPLLATSYEVLDSGDETYYTFYLREGVKFHNQAPFTASDVKYTFDKLLDPQVVSPNASIFSFVKQIEVIDPMTVRFVTEGAGSPLIGYLASAKGTGIIPQGSDMDDLRTHPIGTGPFVFSEWAPGDHITLVKNDDYWQPSIPHLDKVVCKFIADQAASLAALRAGDVDLVDRMVGENALQIQNDPKLKIISGPQNLVQILALNNARPPFDNILVRRAICYAINRDEIIEATNLKAEWGSSVGSHMTPISPYYVDLVGRYPYNPDKARALLNQAGYPNGFSTTIYLPQPYEFHIRTGQIIADELRQVGIDCKLVILEWGQWLERVYKQWDYDMTVIADDVSIEPAANFSKGFERTQEDGSSAYYWQYTNYFLRTLLAQGRKTTDLNERKTIYAMVQTLISDDAVMAWIQVPHQLEGMNSKLMGYHILPLYVLDLQSIYWQD
jgi:peptide/nickel transport system substrate-binding protein